MRSVRHDPGMGNREEEPHASHHTKSHDMTVLPSNIPLQLHFERVLSRYVEEHQMFETIREATDQAIEEVRSRVLAAWE